MHTMMLWMSLKTNSKEWKPNKLLINKKYIKVDKQTQRNTIEDDLIKNQRKIIIDVCYAKLLNCFTFAIIIII